MPETINTILEEIKQIKLELKSVIEAAEVRITLKVEEISRRINKLEKDNNFTAGKLEELERKTKENNIIIFGLKHPKQNIPIDFIITELKNIIGIDIQETDLNNVYPLGKTDSCPIKIEFVSFLKKLAVLKKSKQLKGINISLSNDMTVKQRKEQIILRKHLNLAKQDKNTNCYIKKNKLYVNNQTYTAEDLEESSELCETEEKQKTNSAPNTPIITPTLSRKDSLKNIQKNIFVDKTQQISVPSVPSPVSATGTINKRDSKESSSQQLQKKESDRMKIETRSMVTKKN